MVARGAAFLPHSREELDNWLVVVCGQESQMQREGKLENLILDARNGKRLSIRAPKQDGGYYQCDLPADSEGKRRKIQKHTRLEVLKEVYLFYYGEEYSEKQSVTFKSMWQEWTVYRNSLVATENSNGLSPLTLYRQETDYAKYFCDSELVNVSLKKITTAMLNDELLKIIQQKGVTKKAFTTIMGYLNDLFERAIDSGYIQQNPSKRVNTKMLRMKCQDKATHDDEERILNDIEIYKLLDVIRKDEKATPKKAINYAIELSMYTGLRVGELAALKWSDIVDGVLYVYKSEHEVRVRGQKYEYRIGDTKNRKHRGVPLSNDAIDVLDRLRIVSDAKDDDFLFRDEKTGKRKTAKSIGSATTRRGNSAGIKHVSIHRIRRTVISKLVSENVAISIVADWMGHTVEVSAENYIYNQLTKETQRQQINNALRYGVPTRCVV